MVCPALRSTHSSCNTDVTLIPLPDYNIVNEVPVLATWMHPCSFLVVGESEDCIGNEKFVGSTSLEEKQTIVITRPHALSAKDAGPGIMIQANSGVEVAKDDKLVLFWH